MEQILYDGVHAGREGIVAAGSDRLTAEMKYRLLLQISEKISGSMMLEDVLNRLLDAVGSVVPHDAGGCSRPPSMKQER